MSDKYEKVKSYYDNNVWSKTRVYNAVAKEWITSDEYTTITGEEYTTEE